MLQNLKILRRKCRISQQALGDAVGVSQQSINKYENHDIEPDILTLTKLADYFDTSIDFIVGREQARSAMEGEGQYELSGLEAELVDAVRNLKPDTRGLLVELARSIVTK